MVSEQEWLPKMVEMCLKEEEKRAEKACVLKF
jgi:hypothetical protein